VVAVEASPALVVRWSCQLDWPLLPGTATVDAAEEEAARSWLYPM
jgi:hypothetical protein